MPIRSILPCAARSNRLIGVAKSQPMRPTLRSQRELRTEGHSRVELAGLSAPVVDLAALRPDQPSYLHEGRAASAIRV